VNSGKRLKKNIYNKIKAKGMLREAKAAALSQGAGENLYKILHSTLKNFPLPRYHKGP